MDKKTHVPDTEEGVPSPFAKYADDDTGTIIVMVLKLDRSKLIPYTAMYAVTSTIQLEAFYGCGTQLLLESLLLTAARLEPPDGPLTAIGRVDSMLQDAFESSFAPQK